MHLRAEIDVQNIKAEYHKKYGKTMFTWRHQATTDRDEDDRRTAIERPETTNSDDDSLSLLSILSFNYDLCPSRTPFQHPTNWNSKIRGIRPVAHPVRTQPHSTAPPHPNRTRCVVRHVGGAPVLHRI